ncbi:MAG: hypothetical protein COB14_06290 [Alphaproteobacteria bacterium]|nr:MAG: hypothetical protein COB14_06290 [Alphaproteobacteria bacterium]
MRVIILKYTVVSALVIASGAMLMDVSHHVQRAERDIKHLDREIAREEESIRVLKAEWAYLNNPVRLEALAADYVDLISPEAAQLISDMSVIPDNDPQASIFIPQRSPLHRDISYDASSPKPTQATYPTKHTNNTVSSHTNGGAR